MSKLNEAIVLYPKFNNSENVLFLVDYSHYENTKNPEHFRYNPDVKLVTCGKRKRTEKESHCKPYVFIGENRKTYKVFSDWSALEINTNMVGSND